MKKALAILISVLMITMLIPTALANDSSSPPSTDTPQITDKPQPNITIEPTVTSEPTVKPDPTPEPTATLELTTKPTVTPEPTPESTFTQKSTETVQTMGTVQAMDETSGDYTYTVNDDGKSCTITGYTGAGGDITIPDTITNDSGTYTVTAIGDSAFSGKTVITSVSIPACTTVIGKDAFYNCTSLQTVALHEGMLKIDDESFRFCTSLKSITFPDSVTGIGEYSFANCTSLEIINLPLNITLSRCSFYGSSIKEITVPTHANISFYMAFGECSHLKAVYFQGDAPSSFRSDVFYNSASGFTIYYLASSKGFTNPSWNGYTTAIYDSSILYTVKFDLNGVSGMTPDTQLLYSGVKVFEPKGLTRTGYNLVWYIDSNCTIEWDFNSPIAKDISLYAKWDIITYTITYSLDGGEVDPSTPNPTTYTVETPTFTLNNPFNNGYHFTGWGITGVGGNSMVVTIPQGSHGDIGYFANFESDSVYAYLSDLKVTNGTLISKYSMQTNFNKYTYDYTVLLGNGCTYSDLTFTAVNDADTISVNGNSVTNFRLSIESGGVKTADIAVAYTNYTTHYNLTVMARTNDADLSGIDVYGNLLDPVFNPDILNYYVSPGHAGSFQVGIWASPVDKFATVKVNGEKQNGISLDLLDSSFPKTAVIEVTASDGVTKKTYTVTIKEFSSIPDLSFISIKYGHGVLCPEFNPSITDYYIKSVFKDPSPSIDLLFNTKDPYANVNINGDNNCMHGTGDDYFTGIGKANNLPTRVTIEVTSSDGTAKKTYTLTLYRSSISATYDENGATSGTAPVDGKSYSTGETFTVSANTGNLAKMGCTFDGWNTKADGTGTTYKAFDTFIMSSDDVILYAKWNQVYTVTYNGNGMTGGTVPVDTATYMAGDNVTVLWNTGAMVRKGYDFFCWNTEFDGTGVSYTPGDTFKMPSGKLRLYALWQPVNAYLSSPGITGGTLAGTFKYNKYSYKVNMTEGQDSITFIPAAQNSNAAVTMNKLAVPQTFNVGYNKTKVVTIKVSYRGKTHAYTFKVHRAKCTYNLLNSLGAYVGGSQVQFSEQNKPDNHITFNASVNTYFVYVDENTKKVTIRASGDGLKPQVISPKSKTYTLKYGKEVIAVVKVKSQSGKTNRYYVHIKRASY